jgi:hypothetical protein
MFKYKASQAYAMDVRALEELGLTNGEIKVYLPWSGLERQHQARLLRSQGFLSQKCILYSTGWLRKGLSAIL